MNHWFVAPDLEGTVAYAILTALFGILKTNLSMCKE